MQCFTYNGWKAWGNNDGDISPRESEQFSISWKDFERLALPKLTPADTVIFLSLSSPSHHHADSSEYSEYVDSLAHKVHEKGVALFAVEIEHQQQEREKGYDENSHHHPAVLSSSLVRHLATFELPFLYILDGVPAFAEIALKWVLNSLTTSAHILAGKVFKNRMIGTLPFFAHFFVLISSNW